MSIHCPCVNNSKHRFERQWGEWVVYKKKTLDLKDAKTNLTLKY
jgi:hypothetical protein